MTARRKAAVGWLGAFAVSLAMWAGLWKVIR